MSLVLVVEDDSKTANTIRLYLESAGFEVEIAGDGAIGLSRSRQRQWDLIILDLMLPHVNGFQFCRELRVQSDVPIIILTARTAEEDKLLGLELGSDDYITKPFSPRELVARVKSVLRRSQKTQEPASFELRFGEFVIDARRHEVRFGKSNILLTPTEFKLLETLARRPRRVFTRGELLEKAFGCDFDGLERTVDAHIMNLRKKIEPDPRRPLWITTVFGVGYKFAE